MSDPQESSGFTLVKIKLYQETVKNGQKVTSACSGINHNFVPSDDCYI